MEGSEMELFGVVSSFLQERAESIKQASQSDFFMNGVFSIKTETRPVLVFESMNNLFCNSNTRKVPECRIRR
jgi:hypothetical protein